jgi:hypothetical protein
MSFNAPDINQFKVVGSTEGDVYFPQTKLLLPFDGANGATTTSDLSSSNQSVTFNGNAIISTAQSKFGGSSLYCAADGDYVSVPISSLTNYLHTAADHTIEFWYKSTMGTTEGYWVINTWYSNSYGIYLGYTSGNIQYYIHKNVSGSAALSMSTAVTYSSPTDWHHWAFVRNSGTCTVYLDGTSVASASSAGGEGTTSNNSAYAPRIGTTPVDSSYSLNGYYDGVRISHLARYTGNFTPPTTAHLTSVGDVNKQIIINSTADGVAIGTGGINQARIAKAWCKFTGTGTAAIDESYNVSSITDRGTGKYSVTFSTAMSSSDYSFTASAGSGADSWVGFCTRLSTFSTTVATFTISYVYTSSNGGGSVSVGYNDGTDVSVAVFGN